MASSVEQRLDAVQRKPLAMRGEGCRNSLAECESRRVIGRVIERALALAQIEQKSAAGTLGYADQSAVNRWISGAETALLHRLWAELGPTFRECFLVALAEATASPAIEVRTVVTLRRSAVSA